MIGCEWESVDDESGTAGATGPINAGSGGTSITCGEKTENGDGTIWIKSELVAMGDGISTVYAGTLCFQPLVPGSVTFSAAGFGFSDDGNGNLVGTAGTDGTVSYLSAGWTLDFKGAAIDDQEAIVANYVIGDETNAIVSEGPTTTNNFFFF